MALVEFKDLPYTTAPITADNLNNNFTECNNIIESGSNENGDWIKFSDGVMLCYGTISITSPIDIEAGAVYRGPSERKYFPQTFIQSPVVSITADAPINFVYTANKRNDYFDVYPMSFGTREADNRHLDYMAIGRWK